MKKVLSVFVDESGDAGCEGDTSKYYIVSFVFHNQADDISYLLDKIRNEKPFHVGPLIRNEKPYHAFDILARSKLLRKILLWFSIFPIKTKTIIYTKKELDFDKRKLLTRLSKDILNFLDKHNKFFMSFDKIIIYYDKGQQVVEKALLKSFGTIGYNVEFKDDVKAEKYRLFQLTDFVCSIKLIETKMKNGELSKSETLFFSNQSYFKNYYLKTIKKKELK